MLHVNMKHLFRYFLISIVLSVNVILTSGASIPSLSRIVGGAEAEDAAYPYQVSLRYQGRPFCGGAIISVLYIVTAAHCAAAVTLDGLTVISGTNSLARGGETHSVVKMTIHDNYIGRSDWWRYDIAILTLGAELTITSVQSPIPIATVDPPDNAVVVVTGWGASLNGSNSVPTKLQFMELVTITDTAECLSMMGNVRLYDVHLCAYRAAGIAVCNGDSGGPMVYNGELVGIVSWGQSPCASGVPDVYTRVTLMLDFIETVTGITFSK